MKIGYARVSTEEQNEALQLDALKMAGCERIFTDHASGAKTDRPALTDALAFARPGDTLVVWKLDRLGRSVPHLIAVVTGLKECTIHFVSLTEEIDTTTAGGMLVFHLFAAFAQFERDLIRERTMAGLVAARARGRKGGRRPVVNSEKVALVLTMYESKKHTLAQICKMAQISKATVYRYLEMAKAEAKKQEEQSA